MARKAVSLRLPEELIQWAKARARERSTTFTEVVISALVELREKSTQPYRRGS